MKRFILIALACILPNLNGAFAADAVPVSNLEYEIREFCCAHMYDDKQVDESKVIHYDETSGKWVQGHSPAQKIGNTKYPKGAFDLTIEGYYKRLYNESPARVQKMIRNGADVHTIANIKDQSGNLLRTGTLIDMVDNMINTYDDCKDDKQIEGGFTRATLRTSKYCREIRQMLIDAWPNAKNGGDGTPYSSSSRPTTSTPESKPAEPAKKPETNTKTEDKKTEPTNTTTTGDKWNITIELNSGTGCKTSLSTDKKKNTHFISTCEPKRPGYTFKGWFRDAELTDSAAATGDTDTPIPNSFICRYNTDSNNITFYAKWEPTQYKITYICDATTNTQCSECPAVYRNIEQGNIRLTCAPTKDEFDFIGWADSTNHGKKIESIPAETYKDVTVYALWRAQNSITVTGTITNAQTGETIPGATVYAIDSKGNIYKNGLSNIAARADENGKFNLEQVPNNAKIRVTGYGYTTLETDLRKNMQIKLTPLQKQGNATVMRDLLNEREHKPCTDEQNGIKTGRIEEPTEEYKQGIQQIWDKYTQVLSDLSNKRAEISHTSPKYDELDAEIDKIEAKRNEELKQYTKEHPGRCIPEECLNGFGEKIVNTENGTFVNKPIRNSDGVLECPKQEPTCPSGSVECRNIYSSRAPTIFERIDPVLGAHFAANSSSVWKNDQGKFNTARLASDSIAATVLGTVGGVVTSSVMKKNQVKKGFENIKCTVGGQNVSDYGDEFRVGLWTTTQQPQYK